MSIFRYSDNWRVSHQAQKMAQTAVALAVVAVALGVFINFSIHKIEEGEQRSVPVAVPILIATDRSRCLILVWRLT